MFRSVLILCILLIFSSELSAQKEFADQFNSWYALNSTIRFSDPWGLHADLQYRRSDFIENPLQFLGRIGAEYYLPKGGEVTLGYVFSRQHPYGEQAADFIVDEHRIWQQFSIRTDLGRSRIQHRYRLEQRFLSNRWTDDNGSFQQSEAVLRHRIRYRFQVQIPLNNPALTPKTWFINVSDEIFLGFGKNVEKNILDQNRIFAGLGYRFNEQLNMQMAYQFQYIVKKDGVQVERNHILHLSAFYKLDLRKNKLKIPDQQELHVKR